MSDNLIRYFQYSYVKIIKDDDEKKLPDLFAIYQTNPDHSSKNKKYYRSSDKKTVLSMNKNSNNFYYCVFYKSTEAINGFYFDEVDYTDEPVENRKKPNEKVVTACRFILIKNNSGESVLYEDVKTPKLQYLHDLYREKLNLTFDRFHIKLIPYTKDNSDLRYIDCYTVEWVTKNINGSRNIVQEQRISGKLKSTNKKRGNFIKAEYDKQKREYNFSREVKLTTDDLESIKAVVYNDNDERFEIDLKSFTLRKEQKIDRDNIANHDEIFRLLQNFYYEIDNVGEQITHIGGNDE